MKKILFSLLTAAAAAAPGLCGQFDLQSVSAGDIGPGLEIAVPLPAGDRSPNQPSPIFDLTLKLPFSEINRRLATMGDGMLSAIDPAQPILSRRGQNIVMRNMLLKYNGFEVEPFITLQPSFEGSNRVAVKVARVELDIAFGPNKALPQLSQIDKNAVMEMVANKITGSVTAAMDQAFAKNKVPLRAQDVLVFTYDRLSWTLRAEITPSFVAPLLPGLIENINLSSFSFDDSGFALGVHSGIGAAQLAGHNLSMSDGLVDNFILKYTRDTDFELHPRNYDGGLKFKGDGRVELAGKIYARDFFLKPNVYFTARVFPQLTAPGTVRVTVERVEIDRAYGIGVPDAVSGWLQKKIVTSVVDKVTTNQQLAQTLKARKIDDRTFELNFSNAAFLPSFAKGTVIERLTVGDGMLYLAFRL